MDICLCRSWKTSEMRFKDELESWVVRYPHFYPWIVETAGNSVLFWHSGVGYEIKYGYIFPKLPLNIAEDISKLVQRWDFV